MDGPLRLIASNPLDQLARTIEALLVVASAPLSVAGARRGRGRPHRAGRGRARARRASATPKGAAGSCSSTSPAAGRSARRARRRRRARGCSRSRRSGTSRRPRSRRWRSSRTSGRARGPDIARIRGVAADSAVANLVERGLIAEAGRDDAAGGAIRYRTTPLFERVFGLESLSQLPRLDDVGATRSRSASGCTRSPRSAPRLVRERHRALPRARRARERERDA